MQEELESIVSRILRALPASAAGLREDVRLASQAVIGELLANMDVVSREEFEAQKAVLARCRQQLEQLSKRLGELEAASETHTDR